MIVADELRVTLGAEPAKKIDLPALPTLRRNDCQLRRTKRPDCSFSPRNCSPKRPRKRMKSRSKRRARKVGSFHGYPLVRKIILVILIASHVGHAPNVSATCDQRPMNET
jgi:hypothetical protein